MADLAESADKDERHSRYCLLFVFTATELGGGGKLYQRQRSQVNLHICLKGEASIELA